MKALLLYLMVGNIVFTHADNGFVKHLIKLMGYEMKGSFKVKKQTEDIIFTVFVVVL